MNSTSVKVLASERTIQNIYVLIILQTKILRLLEIQRTGAGDSAELYISMCLAQLGSCAGTQCLPTPPPPLRLPRSLAPGKAKTLLEEMAFCGTVKKLIIKKILDVDKGRKTK